MKELKQFIKESILLLETQQCNTGLEHDKQALLTQLNELELKLILPKVSRSLPTSKEPVSLIIEQINKNTKDVLEAIKEMQVVRIHNGPA